MAESFEDIALQIAELLERKNHDYGNSYTRTRTMFGELAFVIRLYDKINRLVVLTKHKAMVDEAFEDTVRDIAGYCILELAFRQADKASQEESKNDHNQHTK